MKKKLNSCAGFSLVEMLCAVAVLMLLTMMVNTGLSVAMKTYYALTAEAETQLLLNSLTNAIAGELRYAHETKTAGSSGALESYNGGRALTLKDGQVYVDDKELLPKEKDGKWGGAYKNGEYQVKSMTITPTIETDDENNPTGCYFTLNLEVVCKNTGTSAEAKDVVIRCLNPPKKEGTSP